MGRFIMESGKMISGKDKESTTTPKMSGLTKVSGSKTEKKEREKSCIQTELILKVLSPTVLKAVMDSITFPMNFTLMETSPITISKRAYIVISKIIASTKARSKKIFTTGRASTPDKKTNTPTKVLGIRE